MKLTVALSIRLLCNAWLVGCLSAFQVSWVIFFDISPVKLAACLKPPNRANYRTIKAYWKDATTPLGLYFNPQRAIWVIAKMTFEPFQPPCWNCVIGEEWKVPKWAKGGMHHKRLGTTELESYGGAKWPKKKWLSLDFLSTSASYTGSKLVNFSLTM